MRSNFGCLTLAIALSCAGSAAQVRPQMQQTAATPNPAVNALTYTGSISGFIYWDTGNVPFLVPDCSGMWIGATRVSDSSKSWGSKDVWQASTNTLSYSKSGSLVTCAYTLTGVPKGVPLLVGLSEINRPYVVIGMNVWPLPAPGNAQYLLYGWGRLAGGDDVITIQQTPCAALSPRVLISQPSLESGPRSCGNQAVNVNIVLQSLVSETQSAKLSGGALPGKGLAPTERNPMRLTAGGRPAGAAGGSTPEASTASRQTPPLPPSSAGRTGVTTAISNPANRPPEAGFTGGVKPNGTSPITGNASSSLIGLLKQQGAVRIVSGQRTRYALASNAALIGLLRQQKQGGQISAGQTMASQNSNLTTRLAKMTVARSAIFSYVPSSLLTNQENRLCEQQEAQGKPPSIVRVDGQAGPVKFSPDPEANPYTIVGCGFGNSPGTIHLTLLKDEYGGSGWGNANVVTTAAVYTLNFTIASWNDHVIVASLDPNTSAIPDWSHTVLEVKTGASGYLAGGQFFARRQTTLLASIPQTESSLYAAGSPYFLSPATNYYGLNGTAAVMRQGLPGPVAGQDQFNLKLAPGFSVDSTQTDLLVANVGSNVSTQPATLNGNTIIVTYPVVSAQSGNSTIYYSIYGLKVWVTGPVGINPLAQ